MPSAPFLPPLLSPASSSSQEPKLCFLGMTHTLASHLHCRLPKSSFQRVAV